MNMTPLKHELSPGLNRLQVSGQLCLGHLAFQRGDLMLWLNEDLSKEKAERSVYVALTGETVPYEYPVYLGTALSGDGSFVVHAYEVNQRIA